MLAALAAPVAAQQIRLPKKIRIGIIGLEGHTGLIVEPASSLSDVEIVAVSDPDHAALTNFLHRNRGLANAHGYADYRRRVSAFLPWRPQKDI